MWMSTIGRKLKTIGDSFNCHYIGIQLRYVADSFNTQNSIVKGVLAVTMLYLRLVGF